jgi:hypothetical protein
MTSALSRGFEDLIVPVRFPHRGSHIEQTQADTQSGEIPRDKGGHDGASDDNQAGGRKSCRRKSGSA